MKKIIIVALFVLMIGPFGYAGEIWKPRMAFSGVFYSADRWHNVLESNTYSAEIGMLFKERLLLGVGGGYSKSLLRGEPFDLKKQYIPVYADVKYYHSVCKWFEIFGGVEMGCEIATKEKMYKHRKYPSYFLCYPQAGLYVKIYKRLGVEVSFGYRSGMCDFWRPNFSIVF